MRVKVGARKLSYNSNSDCFLHRGLKAVLRGYDPKKLWLNLVIISCWREKVFYRDAWNGSMLL